MWICVQIIFDNILNRNIPWSAVSEYISSEAQDLIDKYVQTKISVGHGYETVGIFGCYLSFRSE